MSHAIRPDTSVPSRRRNENFIPHTITNVLRCARENRDRAVPTDLVGRERHSGTISFSSIGSPQEIPRVSGFLVLRSSEPDSGRSGPPHVPPLGIFLAVFEANRMGNAGCSDLCAGSGRGGGVQTSSRALPRNLGDGLAHSPGVCGPCVGVFDRGSKAFLGTCIASGGPGHGTVDCRRGRGRLAFYPLLRCAGQCCGSFPCGRLLPIFVFLCSEQYDSGALSSSLWRALESTRDVGVSGELATLELGPSQTAD